MNLIAKLLPVSNILLDADLTSKKRIFEQAGLLLENNESISRNLIFDSLFAREKLGSTGLGQGVAIPHGRIKGLKAATGAMIRVQSAVPFDAPDGQNVKLIFILLVPERATDEHLQILSELAQMFSDRPFRERLLGAATPADLQQLINLWEPNAAGQHNPAV
ncbi:MAG: PTS sugar transporter subunit IIA [Betaproteobacteria bacterium]